jgi:hypothetical protein
VAKPQSCAEAALWELCVEYGYCLGRAGDSLLTDVPEDADAFVDAVLLAEGREPLCLTKAERQALVDVVRDWLFDDGRGRGTKSGLPRLSTVA